MNLQPKYSDLILNLLVALAISLVVNFSYVLLLIVDQKSDGQPRPARASVITRGEEGALQVSPDGHGYIVYENRDSIYVPMQRIRRMDLSDGDRLVVERGRPAPSRRPSGDDRTAHAQRRGVRLQHALQPAVENDGTDAAVHLLPGRFVHHALDPHLRPPQLHAGPLRAPLHMVRLAAAALYIVAPVRSGIRDASS